MYNIPGLDRFGGSYVVTEPGSYYVGWQYGDCTFADTVHIRAQCRGCVSNLPEGEELKEMLQNICPDVSEDRLDSRAMNIERARELVKAKDTAACAITEDGPVELALVDIIDFVENIDAPACALPALSRSAGKATAPLSDTCENFSELDSALFVALLRYDSCCSRPFEVAADKAEYCNFGDPVTLTATAGYDMYKWGLADGADTTTIAQYQTTSSGSLVVIALDRSLGCQKKAAAPAITVKDSICGDLPLEVLECAFPNTNGERLKEVHEVVNKYKDQFGLNTPLRLFHYLAQVGHESAGFTKVGEESYCFTRGNTSGWNIFRTNRWQGQIHEDCEDEVPTPRVGEFRNHELRRDPIPCKYVCNCTEDNISNLEAGMNLFNYSRRCMLGHGGTDSGDGWKYRGRGFLQVTWKSNYVDLQAWLEINTDFKGNVVDDPDLINNDLNLAALSSFWFWQKFNLSTFADTDDSEQITRTIHGDITTDEVRRTLYDKIKRCIK